jgi:DNA polymerase-3 subunit gamma/tau
MDVIEIDGASNNSVDQVRQLREDCQYAPSQGRYRIYIIDEVHMLSNAAFNALLKTLEEPPAHVKFIFATTESHKVLPTIVSRCQRFEFRPIADDVISAKLQVIAASEKIEVTGEAVEAIAHLADGGMRDAQSILDQMISFCGESITEEDVLDVYGLASGERIESLARALAAADYEGVIASVEELSAEGRDLYRVLVDVQARLRSDLLEAIKNKGRSERLGSRLTSEAIMRMLDVLHAAEQGVKSGLSDKVNFEMGLLRAIEAGRVRAIDTVIRGLTKIAEKMPAKEDCAPGNPVDDTDGNAAQKKSTVPPPSSQKKAVPGIEELVEKIPPSAREMLEKEFHGQFREVRKVDPNTLS